MGEVIEPFHYILLLDTEVREDEVARDLQQCMGVVVEKDVSRRRPNYTFHGSKIAGDLKRDHIYTDEGIGPPCQSYRYAAGIYVREESEDDAYARIHSGCVCLHARGIYRLSLIGPRDDEVLRLDGEGAGPRRRYPSPCTVTAIYAHPVAAVNNDMFTEDVRAGLVAAYPEIRPSFSAGRLWGFETDDVLVGVHCDKRAGGDEFLANVSSDSEDWGNRPVIRERCAELLVLALQKTRRYELTVEHDFDSVEDEQRNLRVPRKETGEGDS